MTPKVVTATDRGCEMDIERMPDANPYQSPLNAGQDGERSAVEYSSAAKAFLVGAWRGAKFGGKWMGLILGGLTFFLIAAMCALTAYRMYCWPAVAVPCFLAVLKVSGVCLLAFGSTTLFTAVISAIIMGIGEGVSYWRSGRRAKARVEL
jgi:hypothetical protein